MLLSGIVGAVDMSSPRKHGQLTMPAVVMVVMVMVTVVSTGEGGLDAQAGGEPAKINEVELRCVRSVARLTRHVAALRRGVAAATRMAAATLPEDCSAAKARGAWSPWQTIAPPGLPPRRVRCNQATSGGGWTVVLWREPLRPSRPARPGGLGDYGVPDLSDDAADYPSGQRGGSSTHEDEDHVSPLAQPVTDPLFPFVVGGPKLRENKHHDMPNINDLSYDGMASPKSRPTRTSSEEGSFIRLDFNRSWNEYKHGFGDVEGEHWIGLAPLHALTASPGTRWEALVTLKDWDGATSTARYRSFRVAEEAAAYRLHVSGYHATSNSAGDGFAFHHEQPFSTHDRDHDDYRGTHCARQYGAGWWFRRCHVSLLTGRGKGAGQGGPHVLHWRDWAGEQPLHSAALMVRPRH